MWTTIKGWAKRAKMAVVGAVLAVLGALGLYHAAPAQSMTQDVVTWSHPTQYVNGTALPANAIELTRIAWGTSPGGPYPNVVDVPYPGTSATIQRGEQFYGTRCYRAATLLKSGALSEYTQEGCKTVAMPSRPPGNQTVQ